jgi:ADP-heptose:LPS heptosyltransferase
MTSSNKILIVQVTRIGDIIQTYQAAKQLKFENPDVKLYLLGRTNFAKPLRFLLDEVFEEVFYLDTKFYTNTNSLEDSQARVHSLITTLNSYDFDCAINLSFSKVSAYLMSSITTRIKLGNRYNLDGDISIKDPWSQFVFSNTMRGTLNPFNLVDIYKNILGAKGFEAILPVHKPTLDNIVVHPFASQKRKKWGLTKWSELIYQMLKTNDNYTVTIVGAKDEIEEANQLLSSPILAKYSTRIINNVGTTTIEESHMALKAAKLFVGHDSMVSHLASTTGIPVIVLSLGNVRHSETTAYGNSIAITASMNCYPCALTTKCDHFKCHSAINYQVVNKLVSMRLNGIDINPKSMSENISTFHVDKTDIFQTYFDVSGQRLQLLNQKSDSLQESFKAFYEFIWSLVIQDQEIHANLPVLSKDSTAELNRYLEGVNNLFELSNFAITYCNELITETHSKSPSVNKIKELSGKLHEIDNLFLVSEKPYPLLAPMIEFYYVHKANIEGSNIIEVAEESLLIYHKMVNSYSIMYELMKQTVTKNSKRPLEMTVDN